MAAINTSRLKMCFTSVPRMAPSMGNWVSCVSCSSSGSRIGSEQPSVSSGYTGHVVKNVGVMRVRGPPCRLRKLFAVPPDMDMGAEEAHVWERISLLGRQLAVVVSEENYAEAKRLRDQLKDLKGQLTPTEQFLLEKVDQLKSGDLSQKLEAVDTLGEQGDRRVLSSLMSGLMDSNAAVMYRTEKALWKIFMRSGNPETDGLLQEGVNLLQKSDTYAAARDIFTQVIEKSPSFAEGYNKRATVYYLMGDYDKSIQDCKTTLELNPHHFAARSGLGLCYAAIKDYNSALDWFEQACAMHHGLFEIRKCIKALRQARDQGSNT